MRSKIDGTLIGAVASVVVATIGASGGTVAAQARLAGTYVRYVAIGANGTMINGSESMRYGETAMPPASCDLYVPGSPVEGFTIEATGSATFLLTNSGGGFGDGIVTTSGPTVSGRTIRWTGRGTSGTSAVTVDQTFALETDDRFVRVTIVLTNSGTTALSNVYYLRNGDPDHGSCDIGSDFAGANDVRRQPPLADSALVTSGAGDAASAGRFVVLGIGAHDPRARVHVGGFANTDASGEWTTPSDPDGASGDVGVDIIFRETSLAVGASTTFEFFYVWGTSVSDVEARFDEVGFPAAPCVGVAAGGACTTSRGATGVCRAGRCCTGCWDGTRCRGGTSGAQCGVGGAACASCVDGDACTSDTCTAGACSNPDAPAGTSCDDGLFCTSVDTCDGAGTCTGGGRPRCDDLQSCTADTCEESTDACVFTMIGGCIIGGACVGEGTVHVGYPCLHCDPAANPTDWSPRPVGTECAAQRCGGGRLYPARTCAGAPTCPTATSTLCPTGACADAVTCEATCVETGCAADEWCAPSGTCMARLDVAAACVSDDACTSGACIDGVCCDGACDGTCEACDVAGTEGACTAVPAGMDPDMECAIACDGAGACEPEDGGMIIAPDAGADRDAGVEPDAAVDGGPISGPDAGRTLPPGNGCACSVPGRQHDGGAPALLALLAWLTLVLAGRRRRARAPR